MGDRGRCLSLCRKKGKDKAKMMVAGWRILCYNKIACLYASSIADKEMALWKKSWIDMSGPERGSILPFSLCVGLYYGSLYTGHRRGSGQYPDGSLLSGGPAAPAQNAAAIHPVGAGDPGGHHKRGRTPACPDGPPGGRQHRLGKLSILGNFRRPEKCRG